MKTNLRLKHLIAEQDWTVEEIQTLIDTAMRLKHDNALGHYHDHLCRAKTLFMLFFEESTRTRNSFECGIHQLGGHANYLTPKATQIDHGEGPKDTVEVLSRYGHAIGVRNTLVGGNDYMRRLAEHAKIPVYNMQCDIWHPTQSLADLMTIQEKFGKNLRNKKFVISWTYGPGYIRPLSMAQSLIALMPRFGMDVTLAHPPEFGLRPDIMEMAEQNAKDAGVKFEVVHDMQEACKDAHIIYAKSWGPIMHTEDEQEGLAIIEKYKDKGWVCDMDKFKVADKDAIYMHCMPADRGIEVTEEVMDGPMSVIYDEAENRLHINKALMALTMK